MSSEIKRFISSPSLRAHTCTLTFFFTKVPVFGPVMDPNMPVNE